MKNTLTATAIALALFTASTGVVFAHEGSVNLGVGAGVSAHVGDQDENDSVTGDADVEEHDSTTHATTTPWMNGEKEGVEKHFGTTTPPGIVHRSATSTGTHLSVPAFFHWLFSLPATTTIGDIRAQIEASTTASTSPAKGLGFWAHIFGFLGFHKSK